MRKFKYKVINTFTEISEGKLNLLGNQGWELCGVVYYEFSGFTYYIKKEIIK